MLSQDKDDQVAKAGLFFCPVNQPVRSYVRTVRLPECQ